LASRDILLVMVAAAQLGCARDNPLFGDDATDGTTTRTTSSPSGSATSAATTQPTSETSSSDPGTSESVSETQSVVTSGTTSDTTGGATRGTSATETGTCTSVVHTATLTADAFLVDTDGCKGCATANYGATHEHDLFAEVSGVVYYVTKFSDLPVGGEVLAAKLAIAIERQLNGNASLEVHAFWPGCDWPEGTGTGPNTTANGITYNACDPTNDVEYTSGSVAASIGELLVPAVAIDDKVDLVELEIDLDIAAVQDWLEAGGDQLLFSAPVEAGVLEASAREAKAGGGLLLEIITCG
jgi:ribosomal protein L27